MTFSASILRPIFGCIFHAKWTQKRTLGRLLGEKTAQKMSRAKSGDPPWADLGAIWCRKRPKDAFLAIFIDFWPILDGFSITLKQCWSNFRSWINSGAILVRFRTTFERILIIVPITSPNDFFTNFVSIVCYIFPTSPRTTNPQLHKSFW